MSVLYIIGGKITVHSNVSSSVLLSIRTVAISMAIDVIKVFPPIGIARSGNSPDRFIQAEYPGDYYSGSYKDSQYRIKRQGARFHLFGYQSGTSQTIEITLDNADEINWSVELANSKAEAEVFGDGINNLPIPSLRRKMSIEDRASLIIKPGSHTLTCTSSNPSPEAYVFTGSFLDQKVPLGEILD